MDRITAPHSTDTHLPSANMIYNQHIHIPSPSASASPSTAPITPTDVFPWLLQLGCGRAGWYLPFAIERWLVPRSAWASRSVGEKWTRLSVGDVVPDYRLPLVDLEQPVFEVVEVRWPDGEDREEGL